MRRTFSTLRDFYAADARRRGGGETSHGLHWWSDAEQRLFRITRIHTTGELIAVAYGGRASRRLTIVDYTASNPLAIAEDDADVPDDLDDGPVEVLGEFSDDELVRALLWYPRRSSPPSFDEVRERLLRAPRTPAARAAALRRWREALAVEAGQSEAERRASYEVVPLEVLPDERLRHAARCACTYCRANWPLIAEVAVAALASGIDPLDDDALEAWAERQLPDDRDRRFLLSLFQDPIMVMTGDAFYTNGRHRTHAMRRQRVSRAVVYTAAGERAGA